MYAAHRIASSLERIAAVVGDSRFVLDPGALDDVLGTVAAGLHDWIASMGEATHAADLRPGTAGLRLEATELFTALRRRGELGALAWRARSWANDVTHWAEQTAGQSL